MDRIGNIIQDVCDKLKIPYHSNNLLANLDKDDVDVLTESYIRLKEIMGNLYEIENNHPTVINFKKIIAKAINVLDMIDHKLLNEAIELSRDKQTKRKTDGTN